MSYEYKSFDFKSLLLKLLKAKAMHTSPNNVLREYPPVEVINYEQDTRSGGYCDSCYYEETVVEIFYKDAEGHKHYYTYSNNFSELIRELEKLDA